MKINTYLDSTYLKTPAQSGLTEEQTLKKVIALADEADAQNIFAVMIRPDYVKEVKNHLQQLKSGVKVGTVIGFHEGNYSPHEKLSEAEQAINDGADELDFVINYEAYKKGDYQVVEKEVFECTKLCLDHGKTAKWIIEIAALTDVQIADLTKRISTLVEEKFPGQEDKVFVKSSTGFYKTENGKPNGATPEGIKIMKANSGKLPVKAAGGVRSHDEAVQMINLGVTRIGTSSASALLKGDEASSGY